MPKKTELHICVTGQSFSFRPVGALVEARTAIFQGFRYGDGPDAVLVAYGAQGREYFRGLAEHFDLISEGVKAVMGYIFERHVKIYRRALRGRATVEVLFRGHPYGEAGPLMPWVMVTRT